MGRSRHGVALRRRPRPRDGVAGQPRGTGGGKDHVLLPESIDVVCVQIASEICVRSFSSRCIMG